MATLSSLRRSAPAGFLPLLGGLVLVVALLVLMLAQGGRTVANETLAPELARALELATTDAARDGVQIVVTSGLRSHEEQQRLWEEAVQQHGSAEQARRWVLPPEESAHVTGEAIDVAGEGADWLVRHGYRYGLCQRYANEWWHFELRTTPGTACPSLQPDPGS